LDKVRTLLLGMTGFGNSAAEALNQQENVDLIAILTGKRQERPFPYYPCEHLHEMALKNGIPVHEGLRIKEKPTFDFIHSLSPDLIVVSTFTQVITKAVIQIPKFGVINIHPSLLPRYRGPTPTAWSLLNGEEETGISIHFIEDETIDSGRLIVQSRMKILPEDTDGTLRHKLAELSRAALSRAIDRVLTTDHASFPPQDESLATVFRKRTIQDAEISADRPFKEIINRIRAMTPYPGAYVMHRNLKYPVASAEFIPSADASRSPGDDYLDLATREGYVRFFLRKEASRNEEKK
jgi:methionyl-tRNA formyltransferase